MGNRQLFPGKSAKELLVEFRESGRQEPFEEIVRRYAAMVYGVCLRVTSDKHDAEDATQAVFLSLALQTKTNREIKYIGPWLQRVAHRLALDVKKAKTRRRRREEKMGEHLRANGNTNGNGHIPDPAAAPGKEETKTVLMEELNQLPPKYRMPLVMHYFGGMSREEMAAELGCNSSTLGVRVHRGRAMLGKRLAKRGMSISASALPAMLEAAVKTSTLGPLIHSTAATAVKLGAGAMNGSGGGVALASARVIAIARTAAKAVLFAKLRYAVALIIVSVSFALSASGAVAKLKQLDVRSLLPGIGNWIKPLLRSFLPPLQADANDSDENKLASASPASSHGGDLPVRVDLRPLGLDAPSDANAPAARDAKVELPPAPIPVPQKHAAPLAEAPAAAPQLNAVAAAMLEPPPQPLKASPPLANQSSAAPVAMRTASNGSHEKDSALAQADANEPTPAVQLNVDHLALGAGGGGGGGPVESYILPSNTALHAQMETIGESAAALFRQLPGSTNSVASTLTLGKSAGSSGRYEQLGGKTSASHEVVGDEGAGTYVQYDGVNFVNDGVVIGGDNPSTAVTAAIASSVASGGKSHSGKRSSSSSSSDAKTDPALQNFAASPARTLAELSAEVSSPTGPYRLSVGNGPTAVGEYDLSGGSLFAVTQGVGIQGTGVILQKGGENVTSLIDLGVASGSKGLYKLVDGRLVFVSSDNVPSPGIKIGGRGDGTFSLGGATHSGAVVDDNTEANVIVRSKEHGSGTLVGWGKVGLNGVLVNNGQVIADGFKHNHILDLTSFSIVTSKIENPAENGTSGWFARRRGALALPAVAVHAGTGTYTWGEDDADPQIDLVNSVRFKIHGAEHSGYANIALFATNSPMVPTLPDGHKFIGVWSFDAPDIGDFDSVDFQIRYDDALASTFGIDESMLKLWHYDTLYGWQRISGESFSRDTVNNLIAGSSDSRVSLFAVSAPEPGSAVLMLAGGAMLLRRRRR